MREYPEKNASMEKEAIDMSNAAYHAHHAVSKSHLDLIEQSPLHYWARYLDPNRIKPEPTAAMLLGSAFHTMVLEPHLFDEQYAAAPAEINRRTKAGKEEWAAFEAAAEGKTVLAVEQLVQLNAMAESVRNHPAAKLLLGMDGKAEQTYMWSDSQYGVECKCRPDWHAGSVVVDLKTTANASPDMFARSVSSFRYHVQAAWYLRGTPEAEQFLFIACEKEPPYAVAVYAASAEMVAAGQRAADRNLQILAECRAANQWPSYSTTIQPLDLPRWNND